MVKELQMRLLNICKHKMALLLEDGQNGLNKLLTSLPQICTGNISENHITDKFNR